MEIHPDYRRLLKVIRREVPDRAPLAELMVDREIMELFLGHPIRDVADTVEFWWRAGYDY